MGTNEATRAYCQMLKANGVTHDWFYLQADGTYNSVNNENFTPEQIGMIAKAGGYDMVDENGNEIDLELDEYSEEIHLLII